MSCHGIEGAFQHPDVNIGWRRGTARAATTIRTKPGAGVVLHELDAGDGCGIQSVRNPDRDADPVTRPSVAGAGGQDYIWVYARDGGKTGWVRRADVERLPPSDDGHPLGGPTKLHLDFEVGVTTPKPKRPSSCGRPSPTQPNRTVTAAELHLRYSPRGTSFHYLHEGDMVQVLLVDAAGFSFVKVVEAAPDGSARPGSRGWVLAEFLT